MRPLVIAHRGGPAGGPEHTLETFERSLAAGVDGWECDIRITSDDHLVCLHDRRVDRVSNGKGAVTRQTLADLQVLEFHARENGKATLGEVGGSLLTLETVLQFFVDAGKGKRLLIERKHPSRRGRRVVQQLAAMLRRFGLHKADSVSVMSFWPPALTAVRALTPQLETVQLWNSIPPFQAPGGSTSVGPSLRVLRAFPDYVENARSRGKRVLAWTANTTPDLDYAALLKVDAVITDYPEVALAHLKGPPLNGKKS